MNVYLRFSMLNYTIFLQFIWKKEDKDIEMLFMKYYDHQIKKVNIWMYFTVNVMYYIFIHFIYCFVQFV